MFKPCVVTGNGTVPPVFTFPVNHRQQYLIVARPVLVVTKHLAEQFLLLSSTCFASCETEKSDSSCL